MPLLPGKENVGNNIREFHGGKTFAHTEDKFGKKTADKQAVAVSLHAAGGDKSDPHKPHRVAIAKMHPVRLHQHMLDAAAGKHGPLAQQSAQSIMQGAGEPDGDESGQQQPTRDYSSMFGGQGAGQPSTPSPSDRGSMFGGGQ